MELKVLDLQIENLKFDPNNVRKHSEKNIDAIVNSLKKFGQVKPIVIHKDVVVAGNGTLTAAKKLGWKIIKAVTIPDDWSEEKIKAFAIADNRTAQLAEWDDTLLAQQLENLQDYGFELEDLGFSKLKDPFEEIEEFKEIDEDLPVDYKCPKCNYEWSGEPK